MYFIGFHRIFKVTNLKKTNFHHYPEAAVNPHSSLIFSKLYSLFHFNPKYSFWSLFLLDYNRIQVKENSLKEKKNAVSENPSLFLTTFFKLILSVILTNSCRFLFYL